MCLKLKVNDQEKKVLDKTGPQNFLFNISYIRHWSLVYLKRKILIFSVFW